MDIIGKDLQNELKLLQESLVLSYSPGDPTSYFLFGPLASAVTVKRRRRFLSRSESQTTLPGDSESLIQCGSKYPVRTRYSLESNVYYGLDRKVCRSSLCFRPSLGQYMMQYSRQDRWLACLSVTLPYIEWIDRGSKTIHYQCSLHWANLIVLIPSGILSLYKLKILNEIFEWFLLPKKRIQDSAIS